MGDHVDLYFEAKDFVRPTPNDFLDVAACFFSNDFMLAVPVDEPAPCEHEMLFLTTFHPPLFAAEGDGDEMLFLTTFHPLILESLCRKQTTQILAQTHSLSFDAFCFCKISFSISFYRKQKLLVFLKLMIDYPIIYYLIGYDRTSEFFFVAAFSIS
jgi:hypothetical protein